MKESENYALQILQSRLLTETEARADAIAYLDGGTISPMYKSEEQTRIAFIESKRLAEQRIPDLVKAIALIRHQYD